MTERFEIHPHRCGHCLVEALRKAKAVLSEIVGKERAAFLLSEPPENPCTECGGDGYYKGPRLGDDPCEACHGSGDADHVVGCDKFDARDCMAVPKRSRKPKPKPEGDDG